MSERETELVESKAGICNICGQTLESQAEVSIHLTDAHPDAERSDSAEDSLRASSQGEIARGILRDQPLASLFPS